MEEYNTARFNSKLSNALSSIRTILDNTRSPENPEDIGHSYADKYALVEFIINSTIASHIEAWQFLGFTKENVKKMKTWALEKSVTIRFTSEHRCKFNRKKERKVESSTQYEVKVAGLFKATDKVVTKVTDYFWDFEGKYSLIAFQGTNIDDAIQLSSRTGTYEILTSSDVTPEPEVSVNDPIDLNVTWLFNQMDNDLNIMFSIDRNNNKCHTPRRNNETNSAFSFYKQVFNFSQKINNYFLHRLFKIQKHDLDISSINDSSIFIPIFPLIETTNEENGRNIEKSVPCSIVSVQPYGSSKDDPDKTNSLLGSDDLDAFLKEQNRSLNEKINSLKEVFPDSKNLITFSESIIVLILKHSQSICQSFSDGVDFVEEMLRNQLISAIGKEVTPQDFDDYMKFHFRKLFKSQYEPKLFCYAVRRPEHYPEGIFSIEANKNESEGNEAIYSMERCLHTNNNNHIMKFPINSATKIPFGGERYVHTCIRHEFSGSSNLQSQLKIIARARQFSSFILVIGSVISSDEFLPKHAILIQNKDDLLIPLLTEVIPTPKAFKKAIESLSDNQRAFAKAYRSMQLESTLFGVCVIQIKPQLEKLLRLPEDSLTKEIRLTQDIMNLFIEYQISSDLISFEPLPNVNYSNSQRIEEVRKNVKTMLDVIAAEKKKQIEEQQRKNTFNAYSNVVPDTEIRSLNIGDLDCLQYQSSSACYMDAEFCSEPLALEECAFDDDCDFDGFTYCADESAMNAKECESDLDFLCAPEPCSADIPEMPQEIPSEPQQNNNNDNNNEQKQNENDKKEKEFDVDPNAAGSSLLDFTKLPNLLNKNFKLFDTDDALHSTILTADTNWTKKFQQNLLSSPSEILLQEEDLEKEKNKAFDLLDAITRSGALQIDAASFHVVVVVTHCFDKTLINTIVQENVNPIEKVERSALIVGSTMHEASPEELIKDEHLSRVKGGASSHLF